jgi:hypothetical protein
MSTEDSAKLDALKKQEEALLAAIAARESELKTAKGERAETLRHQIFNRKAELKNIRLGLANLDVEAPAAPVKK